MLLSTAVEHQNQTLVVSLRLPGAGIALAYRSDTVPGRRAAFRVHLPPRTAEQPAVRAASVTVAGRTHQIDPALSSWLWDGRDHHGVPVSGQQHVDIHLVTDGGTEHHRVAAGRWHAQMMGLGGFTLAGCDALDPVARTVYSGDGSLRSGVEVVVRDEVLLVPDRDGTTAVFDRAGRLMQQAAGGTTLPTITCHYDPGGRLASLIDRDGSQQRIQRDQTQPAAFTLSGPHGDQVLLELNPHGYLAAVTTPSGARTQLRWTEDGLLTGILDAIGGQRIYTYDTEGRLERVDEGPLGSFILARTDIPHGWTVARVGAQGRERRHSVQRLPDGTLRRESHCCGRSAPTVVERRGPARHTRLPDGTVAVANDDSRTITWPSGATTALQVASTVPAEGDPPTVTRSLAGASYTETFDAATRTVTSTSPAGRVNTITIDDQGRPVQHRQPQGLTESLVYDERGRLVERSDGISYLGIVYDADGRVHSVRDALGRVIQFEHDADGRVVQQRLPDGRTIGVEFSPTGDVTAVHPPGRPPTRSTFSAHGQREADHYPPVDGSSDPVSYRYDGEGALVEIIRADGRRIGRQLGPGGELQTLATAEGNTHYVRDPATGRIMEASTDQTTIRYNWDGPIATSMTIAGVVGGGLRVELDAALRARSWQLAGTPPVNIEHDADGLITKVSDLTIVRDPATGLISARHLGAVTEYREYDPSGLITSILVQAAGQTIYQARRSYGPLGRLTAVTETFQGRQRTTSYRYDEADRLAEVSIDGQVADRFVYDDNGNRTARSGVRANWTASYDDRDRIITTDEHRFAHSRDGEMRWRSGPDGERTFTHDSLGDLVEIELEDGRTVRHHYDAHRRRVATDLDGVVVDRFLYGDQLRVFARIDDAGQVHSRFLHASNALTPDVIERDGRRYLVVVDHIGSPRLVLDGATGEIAQEMEFDVLGAIVNDTRPGFHPFGFAGGLADATTGLVRFGARDYDPTIGRWLTRDPLSFWGGMTNLYGYAAHDPVNHIDPTGTQVELCRAPANMGDIVQTIWPGAEHWWLRTADVEAGMGPHPVKGGLETALVDHTGREGECEQVRHVDEECVSQQLELDRTHRRATPDGSVDIRYGRDTGPYRPWNTCQSIIDDILTSCQTRTPSAWDEVVGTVRRTVLGEGSILPQFDQATPKGYELTGEPVARPVPHVEGQQTPVDGGQPFTPADQTPVDGYASGEGGPLWD